MAPRERCTIGGDGFAKSKTHKKKCQETVMPGSMMCEHHRAEALARVQSLSEKLDALVDGVSPEQRLELERAVEGYVRP